MKKLCVIGVLMALIATFSLSARAIEVDGFVGNLEWDGCPKLDLVRAGQDSLCGITDATVRTKLEREQWVYFGFTAHAPDVTAESPIGASLFVGGQRIARWQQGTGGDCNDLRYSLRGAARVLGDVLGSFSFELELGCKTAEALQALRGLQVELYDARGVNSLRMSCPVALPEPVTAAPPPVTTTRAETTTVPPATTTAKTTATTRITTTRIAYTMTTTTTTTITTTTASAAASTPPSSAAPKAAAPSQASAPPRAAAAPSQAAQQATASIPLPSLTVPQASVPSIAQAAPEPASRQGALLYGTAALLFVLAAALVVVWLRAQKGKGAPAKEDS